MTLVSTLQSKTLSNSPALYNTIIAITGSLLLVLSAKINVPFYPVPQTMQTFVVVGLGLALGSRIAGFSVALYLLQGAAGLPVFAGTPEKGIGLAYMAGPTGGYLFGFLLAAIAVGLLAERGWDKSILKSFVAALLGTAIIFVPGLIWLGSLIGWDKPILALGLYPFVLGGLVKSGLSALVFPATWRFLTRRGIV
jgi:biotin transport system substrate-specific component